MSTPWRSTLLLPLLLVLLSATAHAAGRPVVALLTDFGLENEAVGLCHGVILARNSDIQVVDLCHTVDAFDIAEAALMLRGTSVFPRGSAIVAVVDPGVGTARLPIAVRTRSGLFYIGPNNGVLTYALRTQGIEAAVQLVPGRVNPAWRPGTFDGRDLFAPAAALLATKQDLSAVGDPIAVDALVLLPLPTVRIEPGIVRGHFLREDRPYGNVWTDITSLDLEAAGIALGESLAVEIGSVALTLPYVLTFGIVPEGDPLAYIASAGSLGFAINQGHFRSTYAVPADATVTVRKLRGE